MILIIDRSPLAATNLDNHDLTKQLYIVWKNVKIPMLRLVPLVKYPTPAHRTWYVYAAAADCTAVYWYRRTDIGVVA